MTTHQHNDWCPAGGQAVTEFPSTVDGYEVHSVVLQRCPFCERTKLPVVWSYSRQMWVLQYHRRVWAPDHPIRVRTPQAQSEGRS